MKRKSEECQAILAVYEGVIPQIKIEVDNFSRDSYFWFASFGDFSHGTFSLSGEMKYGAQVARSDLVDFGKLVNSVHSLLNSQYPTEIKLIESRLPRTGVTFRFSPK